MMILPFLRTIAVILAASALTAHVEAQEHIAPKYKVNIPSSADLNYQIKANQFGLSLDGEAHIKWHADAGKFSLVTEMRAMLVGKILEASSEGAIDEYGLAPAAFAEKRFRKETTKASFNRENKIISFSTSKATYPIIGGEQDRNSAIWQLIGIARGDPAKFKAGSEWPMFVVGQRDADPWIFKVLASEKIRTPLGEMHAMHVLKSTVQGEKGQRVDIWLAPSLEWYPVRLRYTDQDGDYIEQVLVNVGKKP